MRVAPPILLLCAGACLGCAGSSSPLPPPAPGVRAPASEADASATDASTDADASEGADAAPEDPATHLARLLAPVPGESVLLLGLHVERIEGYGPMFSSEGVPRTDTRPGYRTVIIRTSHGSAQVVGSLPYLAVPRADGFLFLGESSVRIHLPDDPSVKMYDGSPMPRTYDATALWSTANRGAIGAASRKLEASLKAARKWGVENTEQLVFVTRAASCAVRTESEVTGGALWFRANTSYSLSSLDGAGLSENLLAYVGETTFRRFAARLFSIKPEDVDFERPYRDGFMTYSFLDDVQVVLAHGQGATLLLGAVRRAGNSARTFMESAPVGPAPESLAPRARAVDFDAVSAAIPGAIDAIVSPTGDVVLSFHAKAPPDGGPPEPAPDHIVVWDVAGKKASGELPLAGRLVMVEWSEGAETSRWAAALAPGK